METIRIKYVRGRPNAKLVFNRIRYFFNKENNFAEEVPFAAWLAIRETLDFAIEKKADLILITTTKNISVADFLLGAPEQYIIANSNRIPVMCVNPRAAYINVGQFMWGSRTY